GAVEPSFDAALSAGPVDAEPAEVRAPRRVVPRIDSLIDAIATLAVEVQVSGEMAVSHLPPSRRAGNKPFFIEGLNVFTREWEPPAAGQRYSEFQAGVQLANRSGALNEIEYSEFAQKVQALADALGAMPELPDMLDAVARARELDAFAGAHDAQLALNLQAQGVAWSVGYVQQAAARRGFVAGAVPGRMVLPSATEGDPPLMVLGYDPQAALAEEPEMAAVRELTLSFDVAQTDPALQPFAAWQAHAQALAEEMDARLVDDQGQPLTDASFASIGAELESLYETLARHDLPAGSAAGRRLFS
ncbi:MAG TPA: cell division protein ZipA C-terminal FtsZ-binding domain-containing protein, partial [Burkholderiaceae bacterium]|nr:cell division protein ZipA C-terminal FtsZ-binding domain-containing protein [Burkholderiaceae bacterium]